ncbi:MAG TPA: hypothetical protein DGF10_05025 [Acidimicrobiaceae bacterium]|nr:hypothetical protein [Acidimicrobiaceae bacterium]HCV34010.1 hypothetical protein [Acidimicrobiaceae bacterium]|tara:strand:+ start:407 stop:1063 length:657 start_codon:yes stop_codon:yes gene_type:complete
MNTPALSLTGQATVGDLHLQIPSSEPLVVASGELVAVVGPNGAGKSSLLRLVAGLVSLDSGSLTLCNLIVDNGSTKGFVPPERRRVGWVPQNRLLFEHLTVVGNVGFSPRANSKTTSHLLESLDLKSLANRHPTECSGGQAQRVAIARALAAEPQILLLDEPSTALDVESRHRIHDLLADRSRRPATMLVTHDPAEVADLADRVVRVTSGRVTCVDPS